MDWISVKDRFPENNIPFLYCTHNKKVGVCAKSFHDKEWFIRKYGVTYWKYIVLPEEYCCVELVQEDLEQD